MKTDAIGKNEPAVTLLYVEDDDDTREMVVRGIRRTFPDLTVIAAHNGEIGLGLYDKHRPEIVLTDVSMPVMNGLEMARRIKAIDRDAQIIASTAISETDYLLDAIEIGISRYVLKPIKYQVLFEAIETCLERVVLERQIKKQNDFIRKLSRAVEDNPSMVAIADAAGTIEYANSKFYAVSEYPPDEVIGASLSLIVGNLEPSVSFERICDTVSGGCEWRGEGSSRKRSGAGYYQEIGITAHKDEAGEVANFVAVMQDVTELHQARQEMLKVQKLESLGLLAGGIAHDFNNILTGILGNISLARLHLPEGNEASVRLENAEKAAARAKELTQQLLTFARGGDPIKKVVKLQPLLKEAAEFALHGSNVSCAFRIADDLSAVEVDEGQLVQVINNLILNAVEAMPQGGTVSIEADNLRRPQKADQVKIVITDTGVGIPEQHLGKIFDPYFTTKERGSGLGLATCYSIIRKHGGKIKATSAPGQGSSLEISLPAVPHISAPPAAAPSKLARGAGRILLMDDESEVREVATLILQKFGYTVDCVENGADAIELFSQRAQEGSFFAAVILDLTIPGGIGGLETLKRLREIDPEVEAIVFSGYSNDPIMADYRKHGFTAVLTKPFTVQEMSEALKTLSGPKQ